ncbi:MAG TPA: ABC transporter permease DevC [Vicinamibacteria bacterium]|jgi:putative ABC transport system permease protein
MPAVLHPAALAWHQLRDQPARFLVAVAGVGFAVILMLMQLGFRAALFASAVRFHQRLRADVVLINPLSRALVAMRAFPRLRLYQVLSVPGVESVSAVYVSSSAVWKNLETGWSRDILMIGIDPNQDVLDIPEVKRQREALRLPDVVLFDRASRPEYGAVAETLGGGRTMDIEIGNRRISVVGVYQLGTSFGYDGMVITSDLNYQRIRPVQPAELIDLGLIRVRPGADPDAVRAAVDAVLPEDVQVYTKRQYIDREIGYWAKVTPIGFIFSFGALMGFGVGAVIVYQILFADVSDHLSEYATLKAVGHTDLYLAAVVVSEAAMLAVLGFLPGLGIAHRLYRLTEQATKLPLHLSTQIALSVLGLTMVMCSLAGILALRKVASADPAEVF